MKENLSYVHAMVSRKLRTHNPSQWYVDLVLQVCRGRWRFCWSRFLVSDNQSFGVT